jgi:hypothetical protein
MAIVKLADSYLSMIRKTQQFLAERAAYDRRMLANYEGRARLAHLGLAVPPELSALELVINWPRIVVDSIEERQNVSRITVTGDTDSAALIAKIRDANDLDAELSLWKRDRLIYGRAFLSVGANEEPGGLPIVQVESPREVAVKIDRRHRRVAYAVRLSEVDSFGNPTFATIYLPDRTVLAERRNGEWTQIDVDEHHFGIVPMIPSFNRRMTGEWVGHSEMEDIIPITEATIRTATDMQVAIEVAALPKNLIAGAKKEDFGGTMDGWFNYLKPFLALASSDAKGFQFTAADLANFHGTIELYGKLAASVTGFPAHYFGMTTVNPAAEGTTNNEMERLVGRVERVNSESGGALEEALRLAVNLTGRTVPRGMVNVDWKNPAYTTISQLADAMQKLAGGVALISREGAWDEMGWDDARKEQERTYFEEQAADPEIDALTAKVDSLG